MQNIAIVGAGLLGRLLALLLSKNTALKDQTNVTLFEKGGLNDANTTGRLAAAMVAPTAESVISSKHIVEMGQASIQLWPEILAQLAMPELYQQTGTLVIAHKQDHNDLLHFQQRLKQFDSTNVKSVNNHQLRELEPELNAQFNSGLFLQGEGHVDNHALYDLSQQYIEASNVILELHAQVDINALKSQFDWVIDCRGLGAKSELINTENALRGVRGEVARVKAPEVKLNRPIRMMHPRYPIYIAPKPNNEYVIGATEIESEDDKQPTLRSTMELLSAAYSVHKGFSEAEVLSIQSGLRPTLMNNDPEITLQQNLIQANGLYRHGYLIAPYMLQQILLLMDLPVLSGKLDTQLLNKLS